MNVRCAGVHVRKCWCMLMDRKDAKDTVPPHPPHLLMPGNIGENERGEAIVTMLNDGTPGGRGEVKGKTLDI